MTDGTDPDNGPQIVSFNLGSGGANWSYQATVGDTLTLIASTAGSGLVAKSTDQGNNDTLLTFSAAGGIQNGAQRNSGRTRRMQMTTDQQPGASKIDYYKEGLYLGFQGGSKAGFKLRTFQEAVTAGGRLEGNAQHNGTTDPGLVLVATQDCHKVVTDVFNGHQVWGRLPHYSLRLPQHLSQTPQCDKSKQATPQNQCYSVFEFVPENHENCTIAGEKGVSPCWYRDGDPERNGPYNEFDDQISTLDKETFDKTQYFDYGLPGNRMWHVKQIYRTLIDGSLQPKFPTPLCEFCYQTNYLHAENQADPLIDGNPDPWLAPWDHDPATCVGGRPYFPLP